MMNLEAYLDKFTESGRRILKSAFDESRRRNQNCISPEHILYALLVCESELFNSEIQRRQVDPEKVRLEIERRLEKCRVHSGLGFRIMPDTMEIFKYSIDKARSEGRHIINAGDIIYAQITNKFSLLNEILHSAK